MQEMFWYKTYLKSYSNSKIDYLRSLKNGNLMFAFWVLLYRLAGEQNQNGLVTLSGKTPHTAKTLAKTLRFTERLVESALRELQQLELIMCTDDGAIIILGWEDEQNAYCQSEAARPVQEQSPERVTDTEYAEKRREQNRIAKQRQREKEKLSKNTSQQDVSNNVSNESETGQQSVSSNVSKENEDNINNKINKNKSNELSDAKQTTEETERACAEVLELFNNNCKSLQKPGFLDAKQKAAIAASLDVFGRDALIKCFKKAENSNFLKGNGKNGWKATLDWLVVPENTSKVLNGNYDNAINTTETHFTDSLSSFDSDEFIEAALARAFDGLL